jgi:hypothetical protein
LGTATFLRLFGTFEQPLHRFRSPQPGDDRYAREDTLEAPFSLAPDALPALALGSDAIWPAGA